MSYERMAEAEKRLQDEVEKLLAQAEQVDATEDAQYGKGRRGDELPAELKRREDRLKKIREAKADLEAEAIEMAAAKAATAEAKRLERDDKKSQVETGTEPSKQVVKAPKAEAVPEPKAQRNFTDPESRIMPDGANKGSFVQAYNAQIAVDAHAQIIVAASVTQAANDVRQLVPMAEAIKENVGQLAATTTADAGYFSAANIEHAALAETNLLVPPSRIKHGAEPVMGSNKPDASPAEKMRYKLAQPEGSELYKMRKAIVEPVFGQIKEVRDIRRFRMRGFTAANQEFSFIALTHNVLKLFRSAISIV